MYADFRKGADNLLFGCHGRVGDGGTLDAIAQGFVVNQDSGGRGMGGKTLGIPVINYVGFAGRLHGFSGGGS